MPECNAPSCLKIGLDPILVHLGPVALGWYGLMIAVGFILAIRVALGEAERRGVDPDQLLSAILVAALVGLLGARVYYILESDPGFYLAHPGDALSLWQGGLSFYGGIFGAILGAWLYCARYNLPTLRVLDIGALAAPLGQAVGRIGSIVNGDVPGYFTHGFGVAYTNPHNPLIAPIALGRPMHPVAIYEALVDLALFAFLYLVMRRRRLNPGQLGGFYLAAFSIGELLVYAFRTNPVVLFGLKQGQLTALPVIAAGLWLYLSAPRVDEGTETEVGDEDAGDTPPAEVVGPAEAPAEAADVVAETGGPAPATEEPAPEPDVSHSPAVTSGEAEPA